MLGDRERLRGYRLVRRGATEFTTALPTEPLDEPGLDACASRPAIGRLTQRTEQRSARPPRLARWSGSKRRFAASCSPSIHSRRSRGQQALDAFVEDHTPSGHARPRRADPRPSGPAARRRLVRLRRRAPAGDMKAEGARFGRTQLESREVVQPQTSGRSSRRRLGKWKRNGQGRLRGVRVVAPPEAGPTQPPTPPRGLRWSLPAGRYPTETYRWRAWERLRSGGPRSAAEEVGFCSPNGRLEIVHTQRILTIRPAYPCHWSRREGTCTPGLGSARFSRLVSRGSRSRHASGRPQVGVPPRNTMLHGSLSLTMNSVADGARWALIAVFALAAIEKAMALRARSARWHPVMLVGALRRRFATPLMFGALVADVGAIVLLALQPVAGALAALVLVGAYSFAALGVHSSSGESCRCFWKLANSASRASLIARNSAFVLFGVLVWAVAPETSPLGVLWAAVFVGLVTALAQLQPSRSVAGSSPATAGAAQSGSGAGTDSMRRGAYPYDK